MLVLHAVRGGLPDRRRHRQHSLSPEVTMSSPFESYDDLEDADERLQAADPAERRGAVIPLGHSRDPAPLGPLPRPGAPPPPRARPHVGLGPRAIDGPPPPPSPPHLLGHPLKDVP